MKFWKTMYPILLQLIVFSFMVGGPEAEETGSFGYQSSGNDNMEEEILSEAELEAALEKCYPPNTARTDHATMKYQSSSFTIERSNRMSGVDVSWRLPKSTQFVSRATPLALGMVYFFDVVTTIMSAVATSGALQTVTSVSLLFGPIGYGIAFLVYLTSSVFLQKPAAIVGTQATQELLDEIERRFGILETKLDSLEITIERSVVYTAYRDNQDNINDVMLKFRSLVQHPSNMTLMELQQTCKVKDPHLSLAWIHRHIVYEAVGAELAETIIKDVRYDRSKFRVWIQNILKDAYKAAFLREVCLSTRFGQSPVNKQFEGTGRGNNSFDLICTTSMARKESDTMIRDIAKKLEEAELSLVEGFGKNQLENDLRKLIQEHDPSEDKCILPVKVKEYLQQKYDWVNWWVSLTKQEIGVFSLRGHFAQIPFTFDKKDYNLVALYSENDTVTPPIADQVWWKTDQAPEFWEIQSTTHIEDKRGLYDNMVQIQSKFSDHECGFQPPEFAFYKRKDGSMKSTQNVTFYKNDGKTSRKSHFFYYYKDRTLMNTFECRAGTDELEKLGIVRSERCTAATFGKLVKHLLNFYTNDFAQFGGHQDQDPENHLSISMDKWLTKTYPEFKWTIFMGTQSPISIIDCEESQNCQLEQFQNSTIVAVWTPNCTFQPYVDAANEIFNWTTFYNKELFNGNENIIDQVLAYFDDPLVYAHKKGIQNYDMPVNALKTISNCRSVIIINEVEVNSPLKNQAALEEDAVAKYWMELKVENGTRYVFVQIMFYADYDKPNWCNMKGD